MKTVHLAIVAALLSLPVVIPSTQAQAATASQYSAAGHGRHPTMSNRPSRAIYHQRQHRRHRRY